MRQPFIPAQMSFHGLQDKCMTGAIKLEQKALGVKLLYFFYPCLNSLSE